MRVLGVDPGSLVCGYGVLDEQNQRLAVVTFGVIRMPQKMPFAQRLLILTDRLHELIAEFQPQALALEDIFFAKNAKSALKLGESRGVILVTAARAGLEIAEYTPLEVKQAVVGYGRAEKTQVQHMVKVLLRLQEIPQPDDAADALAIAICHQHSATMRQQLQHAR